MKRTMTSEDEAQERRRLGHIPKALRDASRGTSEALQDANYPSLVDRAALPSLNELQRPGIYLLHLDGEVVYVGQSRNVRARIGSHFADPAKVFDAVSFKPCSIAELDAVESLYIRHYAPRLNNCGLAKSLRNLEAYHPTGLGQPKTDNVCMSGPEAAAYLGITLDALLELHATRQGPRTRRADRIGKKRAWRAEDLRQFAIDRPDLLAAARAYGLAEVLAVDEAGVSGPS